MIDAHAMTSAIMQARLLGVFPPANPVGYFESSWVYTAAIRASAAGAHLASIYFHVVCPISQIKNIATE